MKITPINSIKYKSSQDKNKDTAVQNTTPQMLNQNKNIRILSTNNMSYIIGFKGVSETYNTGIPGPSNILFKKNAEGKRIITIKNENNDRPIFQMVISPIKSGKKEFSGVNCNNNFFRFEKINHLLKKGYEGEIENDEGYPTTIRLTPIDNSGLNLEGTLGNERIAIEKKLVTRKGEFQQVDLGDSQIKGKVGNDHFRIQIINTPKGKEVYGFISSNEDPQDVPYEERFSFLYSGDGVIGTINSESNLLPLILALVENSYNPVYNSPVNYNITLSSKPKPKKEAHYNDSTEGGWTSADRPQYMDDPNWLGYFP